MVRLGVLLCQSPDCACEMLQATVMATDITLQNAKPGVKENNGNVYYTAVSWARLGGAAIKLLKRSDNLSTMCMSPDSQTDPLLTEREKVATDKYTLIQPIVK